MASISSNQLADAVPEESYMLPHDAVEYRRLDKQSHAIWLLLGNRHIHAPVPKDATLLLDVGCGFGNVSRSLALDHPQAQVVGIDLAPVPVGEDLPANLSFVQGNILNLAEEQTRVKQNSADLVYSRLLVAGLRGGLWPEYVKTGMSLLKPGGYLNLVDLCLQAFECADPTRPIETKQRVASGPVDDLRDVSAEQGFDFECGRNLERYMKDAGLVDIQVHEYPWPLGAWLAKDYPQAKGFGFEGQGKGLSAALSMLYRGKYDNEEIERRRQELQELIDNGHDRFILLYAVTGRKPE